MSSDQALRRFGLGRRGSEPGPNDVRAWLEAQLDAPDPMIPHELPSTENAAFVMRRYQEAKQAGAPLPMGFADLFGQDMSEALKHATVTDLPFRERLVWFWSNHFTVSILQGETAPLAGAGSDGKGAGVGAAGTSP